MTFFSRSGSQMKNYMTKFFRNIKLIKKFKLTILFFQVAAGLKVLYPKLRLFYKWLVYSRELSTYTYAITPNNRDYLIHTVAVVTGEAPEQVKKYFNELDLNVELKKKIISLINSSEFRYKKDARCDFGSRLAWYAIVRSLKPKLIVENGVDMGLTAIALCEALMVNHAEGYSGKYVGLDIKHDAGFLIRQARYKDLAEIVIGDALDYLKINNELIDFYFSDGCRTSEYEQIEFSFLMLTMTHLKLLDQTTNLVQQ